MKPHQRYDIRPKKTGARKRQRILSQKRRLIKAGHDAAKLDKMTIVEIRRLLKEAERKKMIKD